MGERGVFVGEKKSIRFGMIPEMPRVMRIKFYQQSQYVWRKRPQIMVDWATVEAETVTDSAKS